MDQVEQPVKSVGDDLLFVLRLVDETGKGDCNCMELVLDICSRFYLGFPTKQLSPCAKKKHGSISSPDTSNHDTQPTFIPVKFRTKRLVRNDI